MRSSRFLLEMVLVVVMVGCGAQKPSSSADAAGDRTGDASAADDAEVSHDATFETAADAPADLIGDAPTDLIGDAAHDPPPADCPHSLESYSQLSSCPPTFPSVTRVCERCSFLCPVTKSCGDLDVYVRDSLSVSVVGICYYDPATAVLVGAMHCSDTTTTRYCGGEQCERAGRTTPSDQSCLATICSVPQDAATDQTTPD